MNTVHYHQAENYSPFFVHTITFQNNVILCYNVTITINTVTKYFFRINSHLYIMSSYLGNCESCSQDYSNLTNCSKYINPKIVL